MRILILFLFLSFSNSVFTQTETITVSVEPYMSLENYEHFKRLVLSTSDDQIEYINGFDFEWGYSYELQVKKLKFEQEYSDGTQYEFTLDKIISKTKVEDSFEFEMTLDPLVWYYFDEEEGDLNYSLQSMNDTTYLYLDEVEIEVPINLKISFDDFTKDRLLKRASFVFINDKRIRLKEWK